VGGKEDAVHGRGTLVRGQFIEALDGVHLAVPERVLGFVVGLGDHEGQVGLAQDRRPEQFVAARNALTGLGCDVELDDV